MFHVDFECYMEKDSWKGGLGNITKYPVYNIMASDFILQ